MNSRVTMDLVAREAGVSPGTVSRVLNGYSMADHTKHKVLNVAEELGYRLDLIDKERRAMRKNCIGVLWMGGQTSKSAHPWRDEMLAALIAAVFRSNYRCMVEFWDRSGEKLPGFFDSVDGCFLIGNFPESFFQSVAQKHAPPW